VNNNNWNVNHNNWGWRNPYVGGWGGGWGAYNGWYHGSWNNWGWGIPAWYATSAVNNAAAVGWLAGASTFAYSNPWYVQPTTVVQPVYDYAEPIPINGYQQDYSQPAPTATATAAYQDAPVVSAPAQPQPPAEPTMDDTTRAAAETFASARDAFKAGNFAKAQSLIDQAIEKVPGDPVMHEFRALTLFAQGKYQDAAATLYAVLSRGPGWDWDTMSSLYSSTDVYTKQLRALESFIKKNPNDSAARFVLAYQYLVTRQTDAAVQQLKEVVKLMPNNQLAADMVKALTAPPGDSSPSAPAPPQPGK